ncbi:SpoIIE family protein phosphatase [Pseudoalteromonas tunicata]|uniref:SpoIIE family protein phosphatase n=1 Tax=Pseudoalteromonas tunicata TaxID=314281 RepID=UPI00273D3025|nr:SpoIIE family protein phosphatase [Pseudoalteromonas tunicata]MDP4985538.1 SpoIIE family protein phosphatase [Pseudoalteromonas tunicata]
MAILFQQRFSLMWPAISEIRQSLLHILTQLDVNEGQIDDAGLVLTEYLTNLLRHSAGEDEAVTLVLSDEGEQICILLIDPTPYFHKLVEQAPNWQVQSGELLEGGMGLALIRHSFPDFSYVAEQGKNHFSFLVKKEKSHKKVVILDDDLTLLPLLAAYLSDVYDIECFSEPNAALDHLKSNRCDLLITDFNFPGITAIEVIAKIRQFKQCQTLPIILISSDHQPDTIYHANQSYIDDYLCKPVSKTQLQLVCDRVLKRKVRRSAGFNSTQISTEFAQSSQQALNDDLKMSAFGGVVTGNGGDFILSKHSGDSTFIIFADVMGHGASAKQETYALKGFIQGFLAFMPHDINLFTNTLSKAVFDEHILAGSLATLLVLRITGRSIEWISAGHPLPIELDRARKVHSWSHSQPLLGLSLQHDYQATTTYLKDGHCLLLFSDGWFENVHCEQTSDQQVLKLLSQISASLDGDEFINTLWQKSFSNLHLEIDDSSLVVLN